MGSQDGKNQEMLGRDERERRRSGKVKEKSLKLNKRAHKRCCDAQDRKSNRFRVETRRPAGVRGAVYGRSALSTLFLVTQPRQHNAIRPANR